MQTTVAELLNDYEGMKDILIKINPKFKKLNNPVLRRTLAKLATVKQAAMVEGMDPNDLLNQLRVAVGQKPLDITTDTNTKPTKEAPKWIEGEPKEVIDANKLLDQGENPLAVVFNKIRLYDKDEFIKITSDFLPEPLIEEFEKKGFEVYTKKINDELFETFIKTK